VSLKALAEAGAFVVCGKFRQTLYFLPFFYMINPIVLFRMRGKALQSPQNMIK
jgi:hypothetical protein